METTLLLKCLPLFLLFSLITLASSKKTYILQMDNSAMPMVFSTHLDWYSSILNSLLNISTNSQSQTTTTRIIYTYNTAFHGLAAHLTDDEASQLALHGAVLAVFPDTIYTLHTTRTPAFLGLNSQELITQSGPSPHHDVIVGVLDTGIWPESQSFNDSSMGPVPSRWKGACEAGRAFDPTRHCNRKIIGARVFYKGYEAATGKINDAVEYRSARDQDGHGSHTAGTVAGSPVTGANLVGYAQGTARGMYPGARLASYKVCWKGGCFSSDILSAMDTAVSDGVDVLSISLGGGVASYFRDTLSVATFGAMEKGVFVSCSAGNGGPGPVSLTNVAPWVTTVGASTLDRDFPAKVRVGSGRVFAGVSIYKGRMRLEAEKLYPLVYLGSNSTIPDPSSLCLEEKILPLVKNQHLLLCTLLIYNSMAMEALPIFLDALLPAWCSILISVTLILAFGEIIPQAVCSQYGLSVGAKLSVVVRLLVISLLPLSYPISKLLDWLLGRGHSALLRRSELKAFVDLHANEAGKGGELTHDETTIIGGALELTEKTAKDAMTPVSEVFSLELNAKLDQDTMDLIMRKGHSRVPVHSGSPTNIIGLILVKNLISCRAEDETSIRNLTIRKIPRFYDHLPLYDILNLFQKGNSHMGVVVKSQQPLLTVMKSNYMVSTPEHSEQKGAYQQCLCLKKERKKPSRNTNSAVHSTEKGGHSISVVDAIELDKDVLVSTENMYILQPCDLDTYPDPDEEVIGIITMEDVMEELLQEEILDETDDYVDVHDKIRINMVPVIRSSPRNSGLILRSPVASARSSYHNTPILRSPIQPFIPSSPIARPTLLNSPVRSRLASPTTFPSPLRSSPLGSYEKLWKPENS